MVKTCCSSGMAARRSRACSVTATVSSIGVPGGSSMLRLLRPWSEVGMKVVGMNGTIASDSTNNPNAIHSVRARCRSAASTQPR